MENPLYIDKQGCDLPIKGFARVMPAVDGAKRAINFVSL
jgi:hypothetical protein